MSSRRGKIVPDTGVLSEYVIKGAPFRGKVEELFRLAADNKLEILIGHLTISETLYVVSRIYQEASVKEPNNEALNFISWVKSKCKVIKMTEEISINAGELKKRLRIALPDCYVIASANIHGGVPLFRKVESEMLSCEKHLRSAGVKFLQDEDWFLP